MYAIEITGMKSGQYSLVKGFIKVFNPEGVGHLETTENIQEAKVYETLTEIEDLYENSNLKTFIIEIHKLDASGTTRTTIPSTL